MLDEPVQGVDDELDVGRLLGLVEPGLAVHQVNVRALEGVDKLQGLRRADLLVLQYSK